MEADEVERSLQEAIDLGLRSDFVGAMNRIDDIRHRYNGADIVLKVRLALEHATFQILSGFEQKGLVNLNWAFGQAHGPEGDLIRMNRVVQFRLIDGFTRYVDAALSGGLVHVDGLFELTTRALEMCDEFQRPDLKAKVFRSRAELAAESGDIEQSIEIYEKAIQICRETGADDVMVLRNFAWTLSNYERLDEAITILEPMLKRDLRRLDLVAVLTQIGHAYLGTGRVELAVEVVERATAFEDEISPNQAAAIWGLQVDVYREVSEFEKAIVAARKMEQASRTLDSPGLRFNALCDLIDVGLDSQQLDEVEGYLAEARTLAEKLDGVTGRQRCAEKVDERQERFEALARL